MWIDFAAGRIGTLSVAPAYRVPHAFATLTQKKWLIVIIPRPLLRGVLVPDTGFASAVPVIATADVPATIRYFEQTLGFKQQWIWGDPPVYAGVRAGGAMLYVTHDPELASTIKERRLSPDIFLWVSDIDSVYAQHCAANAEIQEELTGRPWGVRQYVVREPNGYLLKVAEPQDKDKE